MSRIFPLLRPSVAHRCPNICADANEPDSRKDSPSPHQDAVTRPGHTQQRCLRSMNPLRKALSQQQASVFTLHFYWRITLSFLSSADKIRCFREARF
jgi:hypothetical protein